MYLVAPAPRPYTASSCSLLQALLHTTCLDEAASYTYTHTRSSECSAVRQEDVSDSAAYSREHEEEARRVFSVCDFLALYIYCARRSQLRMLPMSRGLTWPRAPSCECLERKRDTFPVPSSIFARHGSDNAPDGDLRVSDARGPRDPRAFGRSYITPCSGCQQATRYRCFNE